MLKKHLKYGKIMTIGKSQYILGGKFYEDIKTITYK